MTERLFVYGSLAPGRVNARELEGLAGTWEPATVMGTLHPEGWGATMGYPALRPHSDGEAVEGLVFTSDALAAHWPRLDAFEGEAYERVVTTATLADGRRVQAFVYALRR